MDQLRCPSCNSTEFEETARFYIFKYCGGKLERKQEPIVASVTTGGSVERLIERANMFWDAGLHDKARKIYQQVLDIDATNPIAQMRS